MMDMTAVYAILVGWVKLCAAMVKADPKIFNNPDVRKELNALELLTNDVIRN